MESSNISLVMRDILQTGKYSDFTVKCKDHQFKVHKAIVCSQSPFFDAAVCGGFQEASEKVVDLPDDDSDTIRRLLSYLYLQDFDQDGSGPSYQEVNEAEKADHATREGPSDGISINETSESKALSAVGPDKVPYNNLRVYMAADKFGIDPLKDLARDRLASWLKHNWDKEEFPQVVRSVFQFLPPHESELPDIVAHLIAENAQGLLKQESLLDLLEEFWNLTVAVLKEVVECFQNSEVERQRLLALCEQDSFGERLMRKINRISRCRHCQAPFNVRVDSDAMYFETVRCGSCRTRH